MLPVTLVVTTPQRDVREVSGIGLEGAQDIEKKGILLC